jgi:hypothetical protein
MAETTFHSASQWTMVRVRILVSMAGFGDPRYKLGPFHFDAGEIVEVAAGIASRWCTAGVAAPA